MCLNLAAGQLQAWTYRAHHQGNVLQALLPGRAHHQPTGMSAILLTAPTKQEQSEPLAGLHFMMQTPSCLVPCQLCYSVRAMKMYECRKEENKHVPERTDEVNESTMTQTTRATAARAKVQAQSSSIAQLYWLALLTASQPPAPAQLCRAMATRPRPTTQPMYGAQLPLRHTWCMVNK